MKNLFFLKIVVVPAIFFAWLFLAGPDILSWKIPRAQAAISFVGSTRINVNNGADATLDLSSLGLQQGDLVIVAYSIADADNVDMAMAETGGTWTEVADLFSNDTYDANLGVYYKIMGSSPDSSVVLDGVGGTDTDCSAVAMAFRGVNTTTPMDVTATTATGLNTMHPNPPSIDHNNPSGVWTVIAGSNVLGTQGSKTFTFPSGYTTDAVQQSADDTSDGIVGLGYRTSPSDPEDPGVMTASGTDGTSYAWAAVTMALRPIVINVPTVTTQDASSVEATTATGNGNITATGGAAPTRRGFCYMTGTSGDPTTANSVAYDDGSFSTGSYTKSLTGLSEGTSYRVRAYAVNSAGTGYGTTVQILTKPAAPTNVSATDGTYNDKVTVTWTKSTGATGYRVYRNSSDVSGLLGDVATYDDTGAGASVLYGTVTATDGTYEAYVELEVTVSPTPVSETYKVVAVNATGNSDDSSTDTGYRSTAAITYQWQRSADDSDGSYSDISGATTAIYDDTGAPADGSGRYYRCVLNATGSTQYTTDADRGYRSTPGALTFDIVDSGGSSVSSPTVDFASQTFSWSSQDSTGTLGSSSQKMRITNTTSTPNWSLSIAATSGNTSVWSDGGTNSYDFNGATAHLNVNPQSGTITPEGGCSSTGLSKGAAYDFAEGIKDSITLLSADGTANVNCYWDFTGVSLIQHIPAEQAVSSTYSINITLTAS